MKSFIWLVFLSAMIFETNISVAASSAVGVKLTGSSIGFKPGGTSCTDGINCYCDTVVDSLLLRCEDFEASGLYLDWYSAGGIAGNRGGGSYWTQNYSSFQGGQFKNTDPTPRVGPACTFPVCSGNKSEFCSADQGNLVDGQGADCFGPGMNSAACIDIQRGNDLTYEVPGLTLSGANGLGGKVMRGNTHLAERFPPGFGYTCGFTGNIDFGKNVTEVSITMLFALSSNFFLPTETDCYDGPCKHMEWSGNGASGGYEEQWNMGNIGRGSSTLNPYRPFMFTNDCPGVKANATVLVGLDAGNTNLAFRCGAPRIEYAVDPVLYQQASSFPAGTVACHQAHITGLGTTNVTIKIWHNEVLIFHATGLDGTKLINQYYRTAKFDSYTNLNDSGQSIAPTTVKTYRYYDNIHIRNGPPVSCASIQF